MMKLCWPLILSAFPNGTIEMGLVHSCFTSNPPSTVCLRDCMRMCRQASLPYVGTKLHHWTSASLVYFDSSPILLFLSQTLPPFSVSWSLLFFTLISSCASVLNMPTAGSTSSLTPCHLCSCRQQVEYPLRLLKSSAV